MREKRYSLKVIFCVYTSSGFKRFQTKQNKNYKQAEANINLFIRVNKSGFFVSFFEFFFGRIVRVPFLYFVLFFSPL